MGQAPDRGFFRGSDRILGGVCSGIAAALHISAIWVRLGFVLLAFVQGLGLLVYIVLWLVMPEKTDVGTSRSGLDSVSADLRRIGAELRGPFAGFTTSKPAAGSGSTPGGPTAAAPAGRGSQSLVLGLLLVVVGIVVLSGNTGLIKWSLIWPSVLIVIGIALLARSVNRR